MTIQLNIGSNIADRCAQIEQAVGLLYTAVRRLSKEAVITRSRMIESEPWGYSSPNRFLNLGLRVDIPVTLHPEEVLDIVQGAEELICRLSHRNSDGTYRDRRIDIDIIDIDDIQYSSPRLTLPHPRAAGRPFVLIPLQELGGRQANISLSTE